MSARKKSEWQGYINTTGTGTFATVSATAGAGYWPPSWDTPSAPPPAPPPPACHPVIDELWPDATPAMTTTEREDLLDVITNISPGSAFAPLQPDPKRWKP